MRKIIEGNRYWVEGGKLSQYLSDIIDDTVYDFKGSLTDPDFDEVRDSLKKQRLNIDNLMTDDLYILEDVYGAMSGSPPDTEYNDDWIYKFIH